MQSKTTNEKLIFIFDAQPGMVLSRDVLNADGYLIAPKGTILDIDMMAKISSYHVLEVHVEEDILVVKPAANAPKVIDENSTYLDKVRNTEAFKKFEENYEQGIDTLKTQLNNFLHSEPIDIDDMLKKPLDIIKANSNSIQLFDMIHTLRERDDSTFAHSINVALIASVIGQSLNYSEADLRQLLLAGLLHDIGKITIDDSVLNKPGRLTPSEFETIKNHVKNGYDFIKDSDIDVRVKEACLLHHERCDGSGYPFGLKSSQIPPFAKIIAVADIYDAMTANRVYRGAVCPFDVVHIMEKDSFSKLDPAITLPFLRKVASSYIHATIKLSDGNIGEVILINDRDLARPTIKCKNTFIDLSKTPGIAITAII